jgi:hypothetical protein
MSSFERKAWATCAFAFCTVLTGCGTPGAPQPPSLNLPDTVADLSATRAGNEVTLTWTNPKRNTDKTAVKLDVLAHICRREASDTCIPVGPDTMIAPGKSATYVDSLPIALASGKARPVSYFVELRNKRDRSAGLSNAATVLAGEAPKPIDGLKAELRKQGVLLRWTPDGEETAIRLRRKLLTPPSAKTQHGPLAPAPEPREQSLLVDFDSHNDLAIDLTVHFGETYEYRAQRVSRIEVNGITLELDGELSSPVDIEVKDVFPPSVPVGLAAVATTGENGAGTAIDLNWQPNSEPDLAGYVVYRREGAGEWRRISPPNQGIEPAFHDTQVQPGHTYLYAISARDKAGHESALSAEAKETVAQP